MHTFYPRLEAARGVAALVVLLSHCIGAVMTSRPELSLAQQSDAWGVVTRLLVSLVNGHGAVLFFFVLSGFVLSQSSRMGREMRFLWLGAYLVRRFFRLWPAHLVVLVLAAATWIVLERTPATPLLMFPEALGPGQLVIARNYLSGGAAPSSWIDFLKDAGLVSWSINPVTWSLSVEAALSIFMPALAAIALFRSDINRLLVLVALMGLSFIVGYSNYYLLYAFAFYGGALAHPYGRLVVDGLARAIGERVLLYLALLLLVVPSLILQNRPVEVIVLETAACWLMVSFVAFRRDARALAILDTSSARLLGRVSYSLYLVHFPVLVVSLRVLHQIWGVPPSRPVQIVSVVPLIVIVIGASVLAAMALYRWVERPGLMLGRAVQRRLDRRPVSGGVG